MVRDVEADIVLRDKTERGARSAVRSLTKVKKSTEDASKSGDGYSKAAKRMGAASTLVARTAGRAAASVAAVAAAAGPATAGLLGAVKAAVALAKAGSRLAPLVAFLPSLVLAGGQLKGVMALLTMEGSRFTAAFDPVVRAFVDADGNASKLTKRIQDLAARGVRPLAQEFVRVNLPEIAASTGTIATAINRVVRETGRWVNSLEGQRLVANVVRATAVAATQLAPKVSAAAIALGRLANKAGGRAIMGLADLIGRILDKFTAWANSKSTSDINNALDDLNGYLTVLREKFQAIRDFGKWLGDNAGKVKAFSNALAGFAVAVGLLSGNPFAVIIGGLSLLVNNWDRVKSSLTGASSWWTNLWNGIKNNPAVQDFVAAVREHIGRMLPIVRDLWNKLKTEALPALRELKNVVMNELLPAITGFIRAVSPIVAWLYATFGPAVTIVFGAVIRIITSAVRIIAGILNVFSAIITGDWRRLWLGVRQIFVGAWGAVAAAVTGAFRGIRSQISGLISGIVTVVSTIRSRIIGVFAGAGSWLLDAGRRLIEGLASGIRGAAGRVTGAISGIVSRARAAIPSVGSLLGGLFDGGPGWQGVQFAGSEFAASSSGRSRTGGPVQVRSDIRVSLDGAPFYEMTAKAIQVAEDRRDWRNRIGRR